jgi:endonuclease/exonuclease/phosphatase family metal-dependent hydrolase
MQEERKMSSQKFVWWKIILLLLIVALLIVGGYVAYVFLTYSRIEDKVDLTVEGNAQEPAKTGKEYTAVSYNIGFGAYTADFTFFMDGGKESRARSRESVLECVNGTSQAALSFEPDLVLFQEVDTDSTRSWHVDEKEIIRSAFDQTGDWDSAFAPNYHSAYLMYPLNKPHGKSNSGLLTQSRMDITSSLRRSLPIATGFKKFLDLDRCYNYSRIPVENGRELVVFNTHLSAYGTDASQGNSQLQMLFEDMRSEYEKGNYVLCAGDFNHDFTGDSIESFNPGSEESFSWCAPFPDEIIPDGFAKVTDYAEEMVPSTRNTDIPYSEDSFVVILDGFIVSDNIECTYVQNVDEKFRYTDHNPVVLKFLLKDH